MLQIMLSEIQQEYNTFDSEVLNPTFKHNPTPFLKTGARASVVRGVFWDMFSEDRGLGLIH